MAVNEITEMFSLNNCAIISNETSNGTSSPLAPFSTRKKRGGGQVAIHMKI